jgi:hypothetical protein
MREKTSQIQEIQANQSSEKTQILQQKSKILCVQILRKYFIPYFKTKLLEQSNHSRPTALIYATLSLKKAQHILDFFADKTFKTELQTLNPTILDTLCLALQKIQDKLAEKEKTCQTELNFLQDFFNYIQETQNQGMSILLDTLLSKEMLWSLQRSFQIVFSFLLQENLLFHWEISINEELDIWNEKIKILYHHTLNNEAIYLHQAQLIASSQNQGLFVRTLIEAEIQNKISFQLFNVWMGRSFGVDFPFYAFFTPVPSYLQKEWKALLFKKPRIGNKK